MATEWYYSQGQEQCGPVSFEELKSLAQSGTLSEDSLVWNESMEDWGFAGRIDGLIPTNEAAIPEADKRQNSVPSGTTFSELKHSMMATAKTAGQLTAKQAERVKLKTTIPKLYWKLGKHGLSSSVFREEFPKEYQEIDKIQHELAQTAIHQQAKDNTFIEKAKATAGNVFQTAQGSKLSVTQASLIARLGKTIYERHHDNSGPEELVTPIRDALSRIAILEKEIGELSGGVSSYIGKVPPGWKKNPFLIGLSLFFCFPIGLIWMWTQSNWQSRTKWIITGVVCFFVFAIGLSKKDESRPSSDSTSQKESFAASDSPPVTSTAPASPAKEQTKLPPRGRRLVGSSARGSVYDETYADQCRSISDVQGYVDDGTLTIDLTIDKDKWSQMNGQCRLMVRLFDRNGEHLTHFMTNERFTAEARWFNAVGGNPSLNMKFLKHGTNRLAYPVNVRDLRDAAAVEVGFLNFINYP